MSDLRRAVDDTKKRLRDVGEEVRSLINTVRPEESFGQKVIGNPIRRRIERRRERRQRRREERKEAEK